MRVNHARFHKHRDAVDGQCGAWNQRLAILHHCSQHSVPRWQACGLWKGRSMASCVCVCVCWYACLCLCMRTLEHISTCGVLVLHICMYVCMYVYTHVHVHVHLPMHTYHDTSVLEVLKHDEGHTRTRVYVGTISLTRAQCDRLLPALKCSKT